MKIWIAALIFLASQVALASPQVCFQSRTPFEKGRVQNLNLAGMDLSIFNISEEIPRCESLKKVMNTTRVLQISLGIAGVGLMCTGVGVPATALVESAALGLELLNFMVSQLPCKDIEADKKTQRQIRQLICAELNNAGYICRPL